MELSKKKIVANKVRLYAADLQHRPHEGSKITRDAGVGERGCFRSGMEGDVYISYDASAAW